MLIDPGVRGDEMTCLANDLRELGQPVVAGFSTHPHWDHLLWHDSFGTAPRYISGDVKTVHFITYTVRETSAGMGCVLTALAMAN